jgi:hypothetical protein
MPPIEVERSRDVTASTWGPENDGGRDGRVVGGG